MIQVEEWAEIRRLHRAEGRSIRAIARELGLARNTVRAAVRSGAPPGYERVGRGSIVDAVEDAIRRELQACPTMPTTVVAERIGWTRGLTVLRERVRELRPVYQQHGGTVLREKRPHARESVQLQIAHGPATARVLDSSQIAVSSIPIDLNPWRIDQINNL